MYVLTFFISTMLAVASVIAAELWWLRALLAWSAVSFSAIGCAYLFHRPALLMKAESGRMRPLSWLIYGPYFILNHMLFQLHRLSTSEGAGHEIVPRLILCRMTTVRETSLAVPPVAVIDLCSEFPENRLMRLVPGYKLIPVLDGTAPSTQQMRDAVSHIQQWIGQGRVYVHCALGHGRSATIVAAYLLAAGHADSVDQAIELIRRKRHGVGLKTDQMRALTEFAQNNAHC